MLNNKKVIRKKKKALLGAVLYGIIFCILCYGAKKLGQKHAEDEMQGRYVLKQSIKRFCWGQTDLTKESRRFNADMDFCVDRMTELLEAYSKVN